MSAQISNDPLAQVYELLLEWGRKKKAVVASKVSEAQDAATAESESSKPESQVDSTSSSKRLQTRR